jgi:hypothetical protein
MPTVQAPIEAMNMRYDRQRVSLQTEGSVGDGPCVEWMLDVRGVLASVGYQEKCGAEWEGAVGIGKR